MEPPKHGDLKKMLYIVILFGFSFASFYIFSLDRFIVKISRLDLEILQNIQIMQSMIGSNVTQTQGKTKTELKQVIKFESKGNIKKLKKEENDFNNAGRSRNISREMQKIKKERQNICSLDTNELGPIFVNSEPVDILTLKDGDLKFVKSGGQWAPTGCIPRAENHEAENRQEIKNYIRITPGSRSPVLYESLAVIIPFRKRDEHLAIFLRHMHKFLKTQLIRYRIFVIEQVFTLHFNSYPAGKYIIGNGRKRNFDDEYEFNRGKLMNVGFREASKMHPFNCFAFHDIDLLPEDTKNDYACPHSPRHMSVAIDKFNYVLPYEKIFGGIEMFLTQDFEIINGFSNSFWGWGAEDDNLYFRVMSIIGHLTRPSLKVGRYQMLKHFDMEGHGPPDRHSMLRRSKNTEYTSTDGLNSLQYKVNRILVLPLFTLIKVDLQKHEDRLFGVDEFF